MFDDAFADFESQIQARMGRKTLLERFDNTERMKIVIETGTLRTHQCVEAALAGVTERRMADVVDEREGFGKVYVQFESFCDGAGDLCDFERVREAIAKMVGV